MLRLKMFSVNFINVCLIVLILYKSKSVQGEKSLFDDLPLNGAYSADGDVPELEITEIHEQDISIPENKTLNVNEETSLVEPEYIISSTSVNSSENSLFDSLPNQGAMTSDPNSPEYIFDSKTQKRGIFSSDPNGQLRFQLEIEKQPVTEISVRSETSSDVQKLYRVLSPPALPPIPGLQISLEKIPSRNRQTGLYQTPSRNRFPPIGVMHRESIPRVTTVYGKPNRNLKPSSDSGKYLRKEVHYYNNFRDYGRNEYRNHHVQRGYDAFRDLSTSTTDFPVIGPTTSTPPAPASGGSNPPASGGYNSGTSGGYDSGASGGYGYGPDNSATASTISITSTQPTTVTPSITSTLRPNSESGSMGDYDYESLTEDRGTSGGIIDRRVFGARTGFYRTNFNVPSASYTPPQEDYQRQSYPSNAYGPPSQAYGPPPTEAPTVPPPAPSYGPPTSPPAPPQSDPPVTSSATTSISYQTIPVQTIQTQLITVPQITVSSSSPVESESGGIDDGFARPQSPSRPSSAYGAPGPTQSFRQATRSSSGPLFTDDQLALLISASRGTVGTNLFEDDSISGITGNRGFAGSSNLADVFGGGSRLLGVSPLFQPNIQVPTRGINGLIQPQIPFGLPQNRFQGFQTNGGNRAVLTGDAVATISDILREQRLRDAVTDLRGKLRQETRTTERTQQTYRSLFYKGALLLGALSLLPTVATPLAAAAGASPSFLLPLAGRRKREVKLPLPAILNKEDEWDSVQSNSSRSVEKDAFGLNDPKLGFMKKALTETESLFNQMQIKGAVVPQDIKSTLQKYLSPQDIIRNSECVQKRFCETLVQIQSLPNAETFLFLYAIFSNDVETNPWIKEAMVAGRNGKCSIFYCFTDYSQNDKLHRT